MDKIDGLKFFIRCVEKKGIASAGRDFGMSAATASSRLVDLETYYEATLLNRTTRSISLTEEGRILFERAKQLVDEADDLRNRIRLGTSQITGVIKVTAPHDLGRHVIVPILDKYMSDHPGIELELIFADRYQNIIEEGINLAIRLGKTQNSSLISRTLAQNRRVICASPTYWEKHGIPQHPEDLRKHNCLIMHWGKNIDQDWSFQDNQKNINVPVAGNRASNCGDQIKKWCIAGHGIAFKSIWDVRDQLGDGSLVEALTPFTQNQDSALQLLFPGGYPPVGRVRSLIDYLVNHFKTQ